MIKGNDIIIELDGEDIAACRSLDINHEVETQERASEDNAEFKHYVTRRKKWNVSTSYLVLGVSSHLLKVGTVYTVHIHNQGDGTDNLEGQAICTRAKITATRGNMAQGSFEFQGIGRLTGYEDCEWFTLDVSTLDGEDILRP